MICTCPQLNEWRWALDNHLPSPFDKIADWLVRAEQIIYNDDIPAVMNEDTATIISKKLEEHKVSYSQYRTCIRAVDS